MPVRKSLQRTQRRYGLQIKAKREHHNAVQKNCTESVKVLLERLSVVVIGVTHIQRVQNG